MTPRLSFMIGGVQKAGTTALATFLATHPSIRLPKGKEAHVFDAPDYPEAADAVSVDRRLRTHFDDDDWNNDALTLGDATPITILHPEFVRRAHAYNPNMRWIILLRDPVDRAISQWHMERGRGTESWPMWAAFLFERFRLRGHEDNFSWDSPLRYHSYLLRGRYVAQLQQLRSFVPPMNILVLDSKTLRESPESTVEAVLRWLGLARACQIPERTNVFTGQYRRPSAFHPARLIAKALLGRDARHIYTSET